MRIIISLILLAFTFISCAVPFQPQKIVFNDDYYHNPSGFMFPLEMLDFSRDEIYSYDQEKRNIGVSYKSTGSTHETSITLYVYPAGNGTEGRLRDEYLASLQEITNITKSGINATQQATSFNNDGLTINGFKAEIDLNQRKSTLAVFECARWFFKIRITSDHDDFEDHSNIQQKILDLYQPTNLVKSAPLAPLASIYFAPVAFADSVILGSAMGSAFGKMSWASENVDSLELISGFPDLYLDLHISSLLEFVEFERKYPEYSKTQHTEDYLRELNRIIDSGFLSEFILDQYNMIMIIPDEVEKDLDFERFYKWREKNPINIDLNRKFYVISYDE